MVTNYFKLQEKYTFKDLMNIYGVRPPLDNKKLRALLLAALLDARGEGLGRLPLADPIPETMEDYELGFADEIHEFDLLDYDRNIEELDYDDFAFIEDYYFNDTPTYTTTAYDTAILGLGPFILDESKIPQLATEHVLNNVIHSNISTLLDERNQKVTSIEELESFFSNLIEDLRRQKKIYEDERYVTMNQVQQNGGQKP